MSNYSISKSISLYQEAKKYIPGGVNSPVRAFKSVNGDPLFITKAKGGYMYDADGNAYIDMIASWGPMILGHAYPKVIKAVQEAAEKSLSFGAPTEMEIKVAQLIVEMVPTIEKVRMVNSGTEATMSAIRLARAYTKKDKFIKFSGCYHGHGDSYLIDAGSGVATLGIPGSPGVTKGTAKDTLSCPFNDLEAAEKLLKANSGEVAAIILEPVAGNMGLVKPKEGYLDGLRKLCDEHAALLIFDEVMTGFRLAPGGAQQMFNIKPDLTCLGKVIGGGMPVGAYGGRREVMDHIAPDGPVYQAGTLSGNPVAMAAGYATLSELKEKPGIYQKLDETGQALLKGYQDILARLGLPYQVDQLGSMFTLFFNSEKVQDFAGAKACDGQKFATYFKKMLEKGVYLPPSQFESYFFSIAIGEKEVGQMLQAAEDTLKEMH